MDSEFEFKVGDKVRIVYELFSSQKVDLGFAYEMEKYCGMVATIVARREDAEYELGNRSKVFAIDLDNGHWLWVPEWFLPLEKFEPASEEELASMLFN